MRITFKELVTDPVHPIMHGKSPLAKEFNKRQAALWKQGKEMSDFQGVTTVLLEILAEDYDRRYAPVKNVKTKIVNRPKK
jgi:hypothetical protein